MFTMFITVYCPLIEYPRSEYQYQLGWQLLFSSILRLYARADGAAISTSTYWLRARPRGVAAKFEAPEAQQQAAHQHPAQRDSKRSARTPGAQTPGALTQSRSGSSSSSVKRRELPG